MGTEHLTQLILEYRYWILIPLSFVEGPIIAFIAGTMASVGYFNIYFLASLFFVRDVGLDGVYYALGHFGGRTKFVRGMLRKLKITPDHLEQVRELWEKHPARTMLVGKLSYGIASAFIVVAGVVRMPLTIFFKYGSIVAILQYWTLLLLGYLLGNTFGNLGKILENIQYVIAIAAVVLAAYYILTFYFRGEFFKEEEEATDA
jgi:membrane protein DedA with SNARE-associated domain